MVDMCVTVDIGKERETSAPIAARGNSPKSSDRPWMEMLSQECAHSTLAAQVKNLLLRSLPPSHWHIVYVKVVDWLQAFFSRCEYGIQDVERGYHV